MFPNLREVAYIGDILQITPLLLAKAISAEGASHLISGNSLLWPG